MNDSITDIEAQRCVIAIAKEGNKLKTAKLRKQNGTVEVVWTRCSEDGNTDWRLFASECGVSAVPTAKAGANSDRTVVVGFNSAGMAFYHLSMPAVGGEELAAMVKLQAETRLPLPADQMELTWRSGRIKNGEVGVTLAAARTEQLKRFVEDVRTVGPTRILLDCEGIVKAWRTFFSGTEETAVVVSTETQETQICLAEEGRLSNAVVLDMGLDDLSAGESEEQTEITERFAQDMRSVLELFGHGQPDQMPVFVLSDGSPAYVNIVSSLRLAGFNARVALPNAERLKAQGEGGIVDVHEYRVPIGLGLIALEARADELDIFEHLYNPAGKGARRHWFYSPKVAGAIAAAMLVVLAVVSYAVDVASPNAIEKRLSASNADVDMNLLMQRQGLLRTVAQQRPDLLELLSEVNASGENGIKLESLHFKKGQRVTITGQAPGNDLLYRFEESLQSKKGIKEVKMTSSEITASTGGARGPGGSAGPEAARGSRGSAGGRGRQLRFTITFHYKNFTD
jgi:hypothetical protein